MGKGRRVGVVCALLGGLLPGSAVLAQPRAGAAAAVQSQPTPASDALGRDTPRGTLLGFMNAAREGRTELAPQYLDLKAGDPAAVELAHKLFVVLDRRLPPRLTELSDRPEGSLANPLKPDRDVVGSVATESGTLDLVLQRVNRGPTARVWLFSRETLASIPDVYDEIDLVVVDRFLPTFLTKPRFAGVRLFEYLALVLLIPACYRLMGWLAWLLRPVVAAVRRFRGSAVDARANPFPGAARLLLIAVGIRWMLRVFELPLPERVFWSGTAVGLFTAAAVWALLLLNGAAERYLYRQVRASGHAEVAAMLRLGRRIADAAAVAAGVLVILYYVGIDPTAALAGLGIGGIAVALAAQKTLENVIGGLSIIFDKAVRVGDFVRLGETSGAVDDIGLRSTRIRTMDRTILSVPNSQIANANIETLSARDKFWLHHFIGLRYETTTDQMGAVLTGIHTYLAAHPMIDRTDTIRVRLIRFGPSSLDIELFAYVHALDWDGFLETQQEVLLNVMGIVERSGTGMAFPSQTLYFADEGDASSTQRSGPVGSARFDAPRVGPG